MSLPDLDSRFDDLVRELRAAKPQPPATLVDRVARLAEAPAAPLAPRRRRRPLFALAAAAALVLAGLGATLLLGDDSSKRDVAGHVFAQKPTRPRELTPSKAPTNADALRAKAAPARGFTPSETTADSPQVSGATLPPAPLRATEEHASFTLELASRDALAGATQSAMRITRALGGYVVSANTSQPGDGNGDSTLVLRIPIGHVQAAITRLTGLGRILSQQIDLNDLQAPINAQHDRATALRAAIAQLRHELATQVLAPDARARIQAELALDRARLAAAKRRAEALTKRARLARIDLALTTRHTAQPVPPQHPGQAQRTLTHAWHLLGRELAFVLAGLLLLAPVAIVAALAVLARRTLRRREESRLLGRQSVSGA